MMKNIKILLLSILLMSLIIAGCSNGGEKANSKGDKGTKSAGPLSQQMTWSVYDVGSGGYAEMSAIANTLTENYGSQIRMLPSASGVGRMIPLREKTASVGKVGDEIQFAFEARSEFASQDWGPQNVRSVWAPISTLGLAVREDSNIKTVADLKGKKVPFLIGNDSINIKTEAILAHAGLTWDDVKVVELTSYSGQGDALIQGQIEVASMKPDASVLLEADSKIGIRWLEVDPDDAEAWKRVTDVAAWFFPYSIDNGAGMESMTPVLGHGYLIASYADADAEYVYELVKGLDETYAQYKDAVPSLSLYSIDDVLTDPLGVPFHEGTIKFFEEKGLWNEEKQAKNDELVARHDKLKAAWDQVIEEANKEGISKDKFPAFWLERKAELVK